MITFVTAQSAPARAKVMPNNKKTKPRTTKFKQHLIIGWAALKINSDIVVIC
jgi:hypothetical protein